MAHVVSNTIKYNKTIFRNIYAIIREKRLHLKNVSFAMNLKKEILYIMYQHFSLMSVSDNNVADI